MGEQPLQMPTHNGKLAFNVSWKLEKSCQLFTKPLCVQMGLNNLLYGSSHTIWQI